MQHRIKLPANKFDIIYAMKKIIFITFFVIISFPLFSFAQGTATDPTAPSSSAGTAPDSTLPPASATDPSTAPTTQTPASSASIAPTTPVSTPKTTPKVVAPAPVKIVPVATEQSTPNDLNVPPVEPSSNNYIAIIAGVFAVGLGTALFLKLNTKKKDESKKNLKCANIKKLMEEKLNDLTDLKSQLTDKVKDKSIEQIKNIAEGTEVAELLAFVEKRGQEYQKLKELYENCITDFARAKKVIIFHGTEGYPEENWFPWLKEIVEANGAKAFVPQFPTPPIVPAKISEWFEVFKNYEDQIDENTIIVGHSLGGTFALKVLEKLNKKVGAVFFVGAAIGMKPVMNYERDQSFSGFSFDWENIKTKARHFVVFHSDNDPMVGLGNGKELARNLGVELSFVPNAGHFNKKAGYIKFKELWEKLDPLLNKLL